LEYLTGIITDLFIDWNRLLGTDARNRIPELQQTILASDFSFQSLVDLFTSNSDSKQKKLSARGRK
jgi:hypothetical protein